METRMDDWLRGESWWDIAIKEAKKNATPSPSRPRRERAQRSSSDRETPRKATASPSSTPGRLSHGCKEASSASPASAPRTPRTQGTPIFNSRKSTTPGPSPCTPGAGGRRGGGGGCSRSRSRMSSSLSPPPPPTPPPATEAQHLKALFGRMEAHWVQLRPGLAARGEHDAASLRALFDAAGVGVTKHQVALLLDGKDSISLSSLEPTILKGEVGSRQNKTHAPQTPCPRREDSTSKRCKHDPILKMMERNLSIF